MRRKHEAMCLPAFLEKMGREKSEVIMWDTPNNSVDNPPFHHKEVDNLSFYYISTVA